MSGNGQMLLSPRRGRCPPVEKPAPNARASGARSRSSSASRSDRASSGRRPASPGRCRIRSLMLGALGRSAASSRCAARCRSPSWPRRCRKPAASTRTCAKAGGGRAAFLFGWSELVLIRASALGGIASCSANTCSAAFGIDPVEHYLAARGLSAARHRLRRLRQHPSAPTSARPSSACRPRPSSRRWRCWSAASLVLGGGARRGCRSLSPPRQPGLVNRGRQHRAWRSSACSGPTTAGATCRSPRGEVKDPQRNLPRAIILGHAGAHRASTC